MPKREPYAKCEKCGKPIAKDPPRYDVDECRTCERALNREFIMSVSYYVEMSRKAGKVVIL